MWEPLVSMLDSPSFDGSDRHYSANIPEPAC
jgi:hypothetical protein